MKNTHIKNLKQEIDPQIRLEVYKELLEIYQNQLEPNGYYGFCLDLPVVLWGLNSYLDKSPDGLPFHYEDAMIAFPELTFEVTGEIGKAYHSDILSNDLRIEFLKSWIATLE